MPRRTVAFLPEHYYHLYNRGNNRQTIFFDRANYLYFLRGEHHGARTITTNLYI